MLSDLESLWSKLEVERQSIAALVRPLDDAAMGRPGPGGCWSVRQTLAHIAASEHALLLQARGMAEGRQPQLPPGYDLDAENAASVDERQRHTVDQLLAEWAQHREAWATFLENVTPEQLRLTGAHPAFDLQVTLLQLVIVMLKHERNHKADIAAQVAPA